MRIVPVLGAAGAPLAEVAAACAERAGVRACGRAPPLPREHLAQALTAAWLRGQRVYLPAASLLADPVAHDAVLAAAAAAGSAAHACSSARTIARRCAAWRAALPPIVVPPLTYAERLAHAGSDAVPIGAAAPLLPELARRFRYEQPAPSPASARELGRARPRRRAPARCSPRRAPTSTSARWRSRSRRAFARGELMLPPAQARADRRDRRRR